MEDEVSFLKQNQELLLQKIRKLEKGGNNNKGENALIRQLQQQVLSLKQKNKKLKMNQRRKNITQIGQKEKKQATKNNEIKLTAITKKKKSQKTASVTRKSLSQSRNIRPSGISEGKKTLG